MGTRTFLKDEGFNDEPRADLYAKLISKSTSCGAMLAADAFLTSEERESETISKIRFLEWREMTTSSSTLGFRIKSMHVRIYTL